MDHRVIRLTWRQRRHNAAELARFYWHRYVLRSPFHLMGRFSITAYRGEIVRDDEGRILNPVVFETAEVCNLIVLSGKELFLDRLFGLGGAAAVAFLGVGTDSTAATDSQAKLNPVVAGSVSIQPTDPGGVTRTGLTVVAAATFPPGVATFPWREAGLFNGNVNGTSKMLNRLVIPVQTKTANDSWIPRLRISAA